MATVYPFNLYLTHTTIHSKLTHLHSNSWPKKHDQNQFFIRFLLFLSYRMHFLLNTCKCSWIHALYDYKLIIEQRIIFCTKKNTKHTLLQNICYCYYYFIRWGSTTMHQFFFYFCVTQYYSLQLYARVFFLVYLYAYKYNSIYTWYQYNHGKK